MPSGLRGAEGAAGWAEGGAGLRGAEGAAG